MQNIKKIIVGFFTLTLLVLSGCSGGSDATTSSTSVNGVAQKGPFLQGAIAKIYKLDANYDRNVSQVVQTTISNDEGAYSFSSIPWSGLSEIEVSGYFLDENTGATDRNATVTSIVNVTAGGAVNTNVNVLTHMASAKVKELLREGKSLDEANEQVVGEVFGILGRTDLGIDDFGDLDLTDLLGSNATANTELLLLSAALLQSDNYMQDLEALLALYREGGIEAVLGSSLYAQLMQAQQTLDVTEVVGHVSDEVNPATITLPARIQITKNIMSESIEVQLYGTEFIDTNPSISFIVEGGEVTQGTLIIADNNKSASIAVSGDVGGCKDVNVTLSIDYMSLKDVDAMPLMSNKINMHPQTLICAPGPDDNTTDIIVLPDNQDPVAYIGTRYSEDTIGGSDADQEEQYATTAVGVVNNYIGEYSYDRELYPMGAIVHCQWENNASEIVVESDDAACNLDNLVFDTAGVYDYTLKVRDNRDANDSNVLHITVEANTPPSVTLQPSEMQEVSVGETLQITATVVDSDIEDSYHMQWMYSKIGSPTSRGAGISENFSHIFSEIGEYNVSVSVVDSHGARAEASLLVNVIAQAVQNHAPTVRISPAGEKNLSVGERLLLKSIASDDDNDTLSYAWSLKESTALEYTDVATYGATGFSYEFNAVGTYIVRVDVNDSKGGFGDANITVNVTAAVIVTTLEDINITLAVKGEDSFVNGGNDRVAELVQAPQHGLLEFYLIGNEVPSIKYTSQDCFVGEDSFIYKSGNDYGRVNVTITSPSNLSPLSETRTLFNTQSLEGQYLRAKSGSENVEITAQVTHGDASFVVVGNEIINYNYDPEDSYVGSDYLEYNVSETIDSCDYSAVGRLDFIVQEYVPQTKLLGICQDPYTIGSELYKTDGTLNGTSLVKNINSNERNGVGGFLSDEYKIGNLLYFHAYDGDSELWQSDGVNTYENKINNTYEPQSRGNSYPQCFNMIDNKLYFAATNGDRSQYGIYIADGNSVTRVSDNRLSGNPYNYCSEMRYNSETSSIYFWEDDSVDNNISRLKKANMDFSTVDTVVTYEGYEHNAIATLGGTVFYQVKPKSLITSGAANLELWMKKSTGDATEILNGEYQFVQKMVTAEGKVYAMGRLKAFNDDVFDSENRKMRLFEITATGAREVLNLINGDMRYIEYINGNIYFMAWHFDPSTYDEFWDLYKYNIATEEKTLLKTITRMEENNPNHTSPMMQDMFKFEDKIFVRSIYVDSGDNPLHRDQLWVSDGTVDGTVVMHENILPQYGSSMEYNFFSINGEHFMQDENLNVYKTDYTLAGTSLVIPNTCDITPDNFSVESKVNYELSTVYEQNATITGLTYSATKVSIDNGEFSIGDRTHWTTAESTIANGQTIYFRHTSSSEYETMVTTTIYIGDRDAVFSTTTKAETIVNQDTVVVGSLMWEDTSHVKGLANSVTWSEAESYCAGLELATFTNWRLPHSELNTGGSNNEVVTIRIAATDDGNNTIIEGFNPIYQSERIATWTDELVDTGWHIAMIFQYGIENGDSFSDTQDEVNVRCVRDIE